MHQESRAWPLTPDGVAAGTASHNRHLAQQSRVQHHLVLQLLPSVPLAARAKQVPVVP